MHKKSEEGCAKGICRGARAVPGSVPEKIPTFSRGFIFAFRSGAAGSALAASQRLLWPLAKEVTEFQGTGKSTIFLWGNNGGRGVRPFRRWVACPAKFSFFLPFFFLGLRLLPGVGGRSPARRGAWGERGGCPSTPPAPPYSPFYGSAKAVSLAGLYLVRRVSRGRRREPSRPFRPGDVRACCGAPSALRAHGIAFAPAPSLHQRRGRRRGALSGNEGRMTSGRNEAGRQFQRGKLACAVVPGGESFFYSVFFSSSSVCGCCPAWAAEIAFAPAT